MENLIIVDNNDNEIGFGNKMDVHIKEQLHRAFSVFIFDWNDCTMLIQKRALGKYHSGGLWSNACCSHPRKGENMECAINHRLKEELGFEVNCNIEYPDKVNSLLDETNVIYSCGKFQYYAKFETLAENEIDYVYLYSPYHNSFSKDSFHLNPSEISEIKWISIDELRKWMDERPEDFSAWFYSAFEIAYEVLCKQTIARDMLIRGKQ